MLFTPLGLPPIKGLDGVEDDELRTQIWRSAVSQCRNAVPLLVAILFSAALGVVLSRVLGRVWGWPATWLAPAATAIVAIETYNRLSGLAARRMLPDILAAQGRCRRCGYLMSASSSTHCPECGEAGMANAPSEQQQ
jgi:hypothetical protein